MITVGLATVGNTPVTIANFGELLERRLKTFEGCKLTDDTKAQIYQMVQQLCFDLLRTMDWVPGDMADFWDIRINQLDQNRLELNLMPAILRDKKVEYLEDSNTPGITICCDGLEVSASTPIGAQINLARALSVRQQLSAEPEEPARVASDIPEGKTLAEAADDRFVSAWDAQARARYEAYGGAVGWKNFSGGPMPQWDELPRRIRAAWCFASSAPGLNNHLVPHMKIVANGVQLGALVRFVFSGTGEIVYEHGESGGTIHGEVMIEASV